jgi:hypothetical protein
VTRRIEGPVSAPDPGVGEVLGRGVREGVSEGTAVSDGVPLGDPLTVALPDTSVLGVRETVPLGDGPPVDTDEGPVTASTTRNSDPPTTDTTATAAQIRRGPLGS